MSSALLLLRRGRAKWLSHSDLQGSGLGERVSVAPTPQIIQRQFSQSSVVRRIQRPILTLNPERLSTAGQEISDLSNMTEASFQILRSPLSDRTRIEYTGPTAFPPDTKGILYYHQPPALPPLAGELRFRLCDAVSQFVDGKDLEFELGQPWHVTLHAIAKAARYARVRALLLEEGLIDQELVADVEKLPGNGRPNTDSILLYDINQPFVTDLNHIQSRIRLMTRHSQRTTNFALFSSFWKRKEAIAPYTGRMKARFELHDSENPVLGLRFLEVITPVKSVLPNYSWSISEPRAGEPLLRKKRGRRSAFVPWAYSLSRSGTFAASLQQFLADRAVEKIKYGV